MFVNHKSFILLCMKVRQFARPKNRKTYKRIDSTEAVISADKIPHLQKTKNKKTQQQQKTVSKRLSEQYRANIIMNCKSSEIGFKS